jgi:alpha-1,6-mannosyltransferase
MLTDRRGAVRITVFTLLSLAGYIWVGYGTVRSDFGQLLILFGCLSGLYFLALRKRFFNVPFPLVIASAMLLRTSLMLMTPNLSDDYFRFIWDGLLFAHGYNPYLFLPSQFFHGLHTITGITSSLYAGLNSPDYFTVYPPVCEFIFGLSAKLAGGNILGNIIIIRLIILMAEFAVIFLLYRLASKLSISPNLVAIYAFNPLVIIELTGNLHLEAIMLLFLVLSVYLLVQKKQLLAATSFGLAVGVKLLPLIFLPLLIKRLGWVKSITFYTIVGATLIVLFLPFLSVDLITNFFSSLRLYFQTFEFNASLYFLLRWLGYQITGYNVIATLGVILAIAVSLTIIFIAIKERAVTWLSLFQGMLMCLTAYFLLATTVHPWYITSLVLISLFTSYRYPVMWSAVIILSYAAYRTVPYSQNLWLVTIEYVIVLICMGYELFSNLAGSKNDLLFSSTGKDCSI